VLWIHAARNVDVHPKAAMLTRLTAPTAIFGLVEQMQLLATSLTQYFRQFISHIFGAIGAEYRFGEEHCLVLIPSRSKWQNTLIRGRQLCSQFFVFGSLAELLRF